MNIVFHLLVVFFILNVLALFPEFKQKPRYHQFRTWKVVKRNSSGQLFWKVGTKNPGWLAWQPRPEAGKLSRPVFYYGTTPAPKNVTTQIPETTTTPGSTTTSLSTTPKSRTPITKEVFPIQSALGNSSKSCSTKSRSDRFP